MEEKQFKLDRDATKKVIRIINNLNDDENAISFRHPVNHRALGLTDYLEVVKRPMDLGTIRSNLNKNLYIYLEDFVADVYQIWNNCKLYNLETSEIYSLASQMDIYFAKLMNEYFPSFVVDSSIPFIQMQKQYAFQTEIKKMQQNLLKQVGIQPKQNNKRKRTYQATRGGQQQLAQIPSTQSDDPQENKSEMENKKENILEVEQEKEIEQEPEQEQQQEQQQKQEIEQEQIQEEIYPEQQPAIEMKQNEVQWDQLMLLNEEVKKLDKDILKLVVNIIKIYCPQILQEPEKDVYMINFHEVTTECYLKIWELINDFKDSENNSISQNEESFLEV